VNEVGRLVADRYRLTQHIGSGAMGVVWQAHDERLHRTVALKQLLLQPGLTKADADEARGRAMREGRIAARLQHPNAVTVYDVVEDEGQPVLIMEYVPSRSLSAVLERSGTLPPQEVARIGQQVATALVAAHAAGIVHRDIKPGNVLLADDGTVKITDFGISRATGDVTVTATGMLAGTPAYLAPEVAKGEQPGPPSDVFSLGSTLYAAVEGQPPFGHIDNTLALLHAVAAGRTIPPRQAGPLTGPLQQMLSTSPDARPTMVEVMRILSAVAAGQTPPVPTGPVSGPNVMVLPPPRPVGGETTVRTRVGPQTPPPFHPPGAAAATALRSAPSLPQGQTSAWPPRRIAIYAAAILAAALVGILVASMFTDTGNNASADGVTSPPSSTTEQTMANQWAPAAATTEPTTTAGNAGFEQMRTVLATYFGLLPAQPAQAWQLLTPAEQQRNGGLAAYQTVWSQISADHLDLVLPHGSNTVSARVTVVTVAGKSTAVNAVFTFEKSGSQLLISDIAQAGNPKPGRHSANN
jgi:serine/threonine protein kinase